MNKPVASITPLLVTLFLLGPLAHATREMSPKLYPTSLATQSKPAIHSTQDSALTGQFAGIPKELFETITTFLPDPSNLRKTCRAANGIISAMPFYSPLNSLVSKEDKTAFFDKLKVIGKTQSSTYLERFFKDRQLNVELKPSVLDLLRSALATLGNPTQDTREQREKSAVAWFTIENLVNLWLAEMTRSDQTPEIRQQLKLQLAEFGLEFHRAQQLNPPSAQAFGIFMSLILNKFPEILIQPVDVRFANDLDEGTVQQTLVSEIASAARTSDESLNSLVQLSKTHPHFLTNRMTLRTTYTSPIEVRNDEVVPIHRFYLRRQFGVPSLDSWIQSGFSSGSHGIEIDENTKRIFVESAADPRFEIKHFTRDLLLLALAPNLFQSAQGHSLVHSIAHNGEYSENQLLLNWMARNHPSLLRERDAAGNTPVHHLASSSQGSWYALPKLVSQDPSLLTLPNGAGETPVSMALNNPSIDPQFKTQLKDLASHQPISNDKLLPVTPEDAIWNALDTRLQSFGAENMLIVQGIAHPFLMVKNPEAKTRKDAIAFCKKKNMNLITEKQLRWYDEARTLLGQRPQSSWIDRPVWTIASPEFYYLSSHGKKIKMKNRMWKDFQDYDSHRPPSDSDPHTYQTQFICVKDVSIQNGIAAFQ